MRSSTTSRAPRLTLLLAVMGVALSLAALATFPGMSLAKQGDKDELRGEFHGIVEARPDGRLPGEWVIGGRTVVADTGTEFDQVEGALTVGRCVKVEIRAGRVHEIDSEPMSNCR